MATRNGKPAETPATVETVTPAETPAVETPAEPGTEVETSPVEQDVTPEAPETVVADVQTEGDPRQSALAALVYGTGPEQVVTADTELVVDDSEVLDFGGRSKGVVLFSYYNQFVDGVFRQAKKGQVIKTDAKSLERGIRIKALKKLEG